MHKARELVHKSEFSDEGEDWAPDEEAIEQKKGYGHERKSSIANVLFKGSSFSTVGPLTGAPNEAQLGPLERKTKSKLCGRALDDYKLVEQYNFEKFDLIDINQAKDR